LGSWLSAVEFTSWPEAVWRLALGKQPSAGVEEIAEGAIK